MNILICDDMQECTRELENVLTKGGSESIGRSFNVNTAVFHNPNDVLDYIRNGELVDVCFLDIIMPKMSGIALARQLRLEGYTGKIVFLSTSREYGPESYSVSAFDYLIKPPAPESVKNILEKIKQERLNKDTRDIFIKGSGITKSVLLRDISHAEVMNHKVYFRLKNGSEIETYTTFREAVSELKLDPRFVQCHNSFIINMEDIAEIVERNIVLRNGKRISITRKYYDAKNIFYKWKFGGNNDS